MMRVRAIVLAVLLSANLCGACLCVPTAFAESEQAGAPSAAAGEAASAAAAQAGNAQGEASSEADATGKSAESTVSEIVDALGDNLVDPTQRADNSFIYDTTIESLFDESTLYDNRTVQVVGEAIGDLINANDAEGNCWITLTSTDADNPSSISVLISEDQARQIDHFGRYGVTGTIFQVRGTFHQACSEHDGLPDIHATSSQVITRGIEHPDQFDAGAFVPGLIAVLVGVALLFAFYVARERAR